MLPSTTAPSSSVAPQAAENLPSSSHHHQLPVTSLPTLTDNFFLEDLAEGDKTDITDDDLALLSSPSLITCSDQSYYESDTMPSMMQIPPSANPPLQCIPPFNLMVQHRFHPMARVDDGVLCETTNMCA